MYLAWNELRRARARFGLLVAAVALLVFLILTQQTLQAGLIDSFVSGIRSQSAPVLVLTVDGRRNLAASVDHPRPRRRRGRRARGGPHRAARPALDGGAGRRDRHPGRRDGLRPRRPGRADHGVGRPAPSLRPAAGEVVASDTAGAGFAVGDRVARRARRPRADGRRAWPADAQLQASPTLWAPWTDLRSGRAGVEPRRPGPAAQRHHPRTGGRHHT